MCPCCISQEIDAAAKAEVSVEPKDVSDGALFGALASIVTSEAESQSTTVTMDVDASVQKEEAAAAEPLATEPDSVATSEAEQHSMTDEDLVDGAVKAPGENNETNLSKPAASSMDATPSDEPQQLQPARHEKGSPIAQQIASADEGDGGTAVEISASALEAGSTVEVFSASQNTWVKAEVRTVEDDEVQVVYDGRVKWVDRDDSSMLRIPDDELQADPKARETGAPDNSAPALQTLATTATTRTKKAPATATAKKIAPATAATKVAPSAKATASTTKTATATATATATKTSGAPTVAAAKKVTTAKTAATTTTTKTTAASTVVATKKSETATVTAKTVQATATKKVPTAIATATKKASTAVAGGSKKTAVATAKKITPMQKSNAARRLVRKEGTEATRMLTRSCVGRGTREISMSTRNYCRSWKLITHACSSGTTSTKPS